MNTAMLLLRNNKRVADSILNVLAADDHTRGSLFTRLEKIKRLDKFPTKYSTQPDLARSYLLADRNYAIIDSIAFISKQPAQYNKKKGTVYFFKYRLKKDEGWKIGISGLQPENINEVSSNNKLVRLTEKKIKDDEPLDDQLDKQLKRLLFSLSKTGKNFYLGENLGRFRKDDY